MNEYQREEGEEEEEMDSEIEKLQLSGFISIAWLQIEGTAGPTERRK